VRIPNTSTPPGLAIHELTRDFRLEDVWALPTPGGPDDFPRLVQDSPRATHARLVPRRPHALRDPVEARRAARSGRPDAGLGSRVPTLRDGCR